MHESRNIFGKKISTFLRKILLTDEELSLTVRNYPAVNNWNVIYYVIIVETIEAWKTIKEGVPRFNACPFLLALKPITVIRMHLPDVQR